MVRAGKLKSGAAKKVNRWRSSSSSNPEIKRHRGAALARKGLAQAAPVGAPGLTADSLAVLDQMTGAAQRADPDIGDLDLTSEASGGTFRTMVSGVSDCTNITFNRIKTYWNKNPEKHREVVAVLAAITEVIREKGFSDESETAYFAVLSTTLTQVQTEESLAAVSYLFALNLRQVSPGVIHKNFAELIQMILGLLAKNFNSTALLKSLVQSLGTILKRGTTPESWTQQDTKSALSALLAFVLHPKPKVRKAAQKGCTLLVHTSGISTSAVDQVAEFAAGELKKSTKDQHTLLLLTFLRSVIFMFPSGRQKDICQTCLRLQTLGTQMVRIQSMRTINEYLRGCVRQAQKVVLAELTSGGSESESPDPLDVEELSDKIQNVRLSNLPVDLVGKLLSALREVKPAAGDKFVTAGWLEVIHSCCFTISSSDQPKIIFKHLPKIIQSVLSLMEEPDNAPDCASSIQKCLLISLRHLDELDISENGAGAQILNELLNGISYQYSTVMDSCLDCISAFYTSLPQNLVLNENSINILAKPLESLTPIRRNPHFSHKIALDSCVGAILGVIGPSAFLSKLPLKISGNPEIDGEIELKWILPIFETKMDRNVEISVFFREIANVADSMLTQATKNLDKFESAVYFTLYREMWTLFPKFCQNLKDKPDLFLRPAYAKGLNSILESKMNHHQEIKQFILTGLRKLCIFAGQEGNLEYKQVLTKYSSNYVKTFLNMYRNRELSSNVLSCAKEFVKILPVEKSVEFFKLAKEKAENDSDENLRPLYWDIVVLVVPWTTFDILTKIFDEALEMTKDNGANIQKKGWRILEQIASTGNPVCSEIMKNSEKTILDGMMSSLGTCAASARKPRLQLLEIILPEVEPEVLKSLVPELILCTKDKNAISRTLSYSLLSQICERFSEMNSENDSILEFIQILLQGLNGSPLTVACTLNVVTRIMYDFRSVIPAPVHGMILENVLILMSSSAREILKSTVSFLISLTKTLPTAGLAPHVERIITAIVNWKPETRNPFRLKVRRLLERLVKKFGFELVQKFVPEKNPIGKMLANAKKQRARTERKLAQQNDEEESDDEPDEMGPAETLDDMIDESDEEEENGTKQKTKKQKRKHQTQILEDPTEVHDFLSPSAAQSLTRNVPKKFNAKQRKMDVDDDEIGTAPDGRILVREKQNKKVDQDMLSSDEEDGIPENIRMSDQKASMMSQRDVDSNRKKKNIPDIGKSGSLYKAAKAGGDVKRKGKQDPYSYLPLRKDMLNKRNRKKGGVPGLSNIVRSAKRGVQKGKRNRKSKLL